MTTKIDWTDETWNPIVGCSKCSPGCQNCYAEKMAARLASMKIRGYTEVVSADRKWNGKTAFVESALDKPLRWRKPRRIFVCSMSDLFHKTVPSNRVYSILEVTQKTQQHQYQILTKRPRKMRGCINGFKNRHGGLPLKNVWLGVTAESQTEADKRIPYLLDTPAALRFISVEPMLGPINLSEYIGALDWVICGGESGPEARPMHPDWARDLRDQCAAAGVPFFFKQWGKWIPDQYKTEFFSKEIDASFAGKLTPMYCVFTTSGPKRKGRLTSYRIYPSNLSGVRTIRHLTCVQTSIKHKLDSCEHHEFPDTSQVPV